MFLNFKDCQVVVSGQPIMVESASINYNSNLDPVFSAGFKNIVGYGINGTPQNTLSLIYFIETNNDPIFTGYNQLLTNNIESFGEFPISVGGISGGYYLTNYNIDMSDGNLIMAKADFISFNNVSGNLQSNPSLNYNLTNNSGLAHSWTTRLMIDETHAYDAISAHSFSYNCAFNWEPIYRLGSTLPQQVQLLGGKEELSIELESFNGIGYSGNTSEDIIGSKNLFIKMSPLQSLWEGDCNNCLMIHNLNSGYISSKEMSASAGSLIKTNLQITRIF